MGEAQHRWVGGSNLGSLVGLLGSGPEGAGDQRVRTRWPASAGPAV